jgi:hypothetical protein
MPGRLDLRTDILPKAQQEIWPLLAPAPRLSFVLYGGTAVALHLGHRISVDFDFFRSAPLDPRELETSFAFMGGAETIQEDKNTRVLNVTMPSGPVRVSFFGGLGIGKVAPAIQTSRCGRVIQPCWSRRSKICWPQNSRRRWTVRRAETTATSPRCFPLAHLWKEDSAPSPKCMAETQALRCGR